MTIKNSQSLLIIGGLLTVIGAISQFANLNWAPYVFGLGATIVIVLQGLQISNNSRSDSRQYRLAKIAFLSSLLLGLSTYFMAIGSNSWVVSLLAYSSTTIFLSFRTNSN
jgi:hypothetical protein